MHSSVKIQAIVRNGCIVVDPQPTALPEGTVLALVEDDPYAYLDDHDDLDDEEREKLHAALDKSWGQVQRGEYARSLEEIVKDL